MRWYFSRLFPSEIQSRFSTIVLLDINSTRELSELKAERDFWALLEILTKAKLLYDIDETECDSKLDKTLKDSLRNLDVAATTSISSIVEQAYTVDDRVKKGAVLKEWIEKAASDSVSAIAPTYREPWSATLERILRSGNGNGNGISHNHAPLVCSIDPDGQFLSEEPLELIPLDGVDRLDQESLLKYIWQLIRCGLIVEAQKAAATHGVYWLVASLLGVAYNKLPELSPLEKSSEEMVESFENDDVVFLSRVGNQRQPLWLRTCWRYADRLASNPKNLSASAVVGTSTPFPFSLSSPPLKKNRNEDSLVGILEASIYAALSNNTKVLMRSPVISTWQDRVWILLKAVHERDTLKIIHRYRCLKAQLSSFFPGCSDAIIAAETELLDLCEHDIGHMSTADCKYLLQRVNPPTKVDGESVILQLQAALMAGKGGLDLFLRGPLTTILKAAKDKPATEWTDFPGNAIVYRLFCHLCMWLRSFSPLESSSDPRAPSAEHKGEAVELKDLVSDELLFLAIETYVDHLIRTDQPLLVASYVTFLSRSRRISKYAQLLQSLQSPQKRRLSRRGQVAALSGIEEGQAPAVLRLANTLFADDVIDITRTVAERTHSIKSASGNNNALEDFHFSPPHRMRKLTAKSDVSSSLRTVRFQLSDSDGANFSSPIVPAATPATPIDDERPLRSVRSRVATPRNFKRLSSPAAISAVSTTATSRVSRRSTYFTSLEEEDTLDLDDVVAEAANMMNMEAEGAAMEGVLECMEALRWLYYEPSHRLEAVRQTNRLALQFISTDDASLLPLLRRLVVSGDYLPLNSVAIGYQQLQFRKDELDEMIGPTLYGQLSPSRGGKKIIGFGNGEELDNNNIDADASALNPVEEKIQLVREELKLAEGMWDAQVSLLELWQLYLGAMSDAAAFSQVILSPLTNQCTHSFIHSFIGSSGFDGGTQSLCGQQGRGGRVSRRTVRHSPDEGGGASHGGALEDVAVRVGQLREPQPLERLQRGVGPRGGCRRRGTRRPRREITIAAARADQCRLWSRSGR